MASGKELECKIGTAVADPWSQATLQGFANKAVEEKTGLIRRRLGDEDLQLSCKCPVSLLV
jgi:hypothetical protein